MRQTKIYAIMLLPLGVFFYALPLAQAASGDVDATFNPDAVVAKVTEDSATFLRSLQHINVTS